MYNVGERKRQCRCQNGFHGTRTSAWDHYTIRGHLHQLEEHEHQHHRHAGPRRLHSGGGEGPAGLRWRYSRPVRRGRGAESDNDC